MAYQYDIFLSYTHGTLVEEWLNQQFLRLFKDYLELELGREFKLFIDRDGIGTGDNWPARLKSALAHSRCMIALWSPQYFQSMWCRRECFAMMYREKQLGYRSDANPKGLLLPINIWDGDRFPDYAKMIHYLDFTTYFRVRGGFENSERYVHFQDQLIAWTTHDVANAIETAPEWDASWTSNDWLDRHDDIPPPPDIDIEPPSLTE